jgi:hypothetical protein
MPGIISNWVKSGSPHSIRIILLLNQTLIQRYTTYSVDRLSKPVINCTLEQVPPIHFVKFPTLCCQAELTSSLHYMKPPFNLFLCHVRSVVVRIKKESGCAQWISSRSPQTWHNDTIFFTLHLIVDDIQDVWKRASQWYSIYYFVASVSKTFTLKGIQTIHRSIPWQGKRRQDSNFQATTFRYKVISGHKL